MRFVRLNCRENCRSLVTFDRKEIALLGTLTTPSRGWPRYCRKVCLTKMVQNGPNDHFGQNDLIPNWILAFARPKWTKMDQNVPFWPEEVYFGPFRSANRSLAIPDQGPYQITEHYAIAIYYA